MNPISGLARAVRAELRKTFATRGTWFAYALLIAATITFSFAEVAGRHTDAGFSGGGDDDIVATALAGALLGSIVAAVMGVIAIGNEYGTGLITSTFTAEPRRTRVLAAKTIVVGLATTLLGIIAAWTAIIATRPMQRANGFIAPGYPDPDLTSAPVLRAVFGTGLVIGAFALLALGVAMIVRRNAIAIPIVIALMVVPAMMSIDENLARKVQGWTPFAGFSIQHTIDRHDYYTAPWAGLAVTAAYAAAAILTGIAVTRRQDV